MIVTEHIIINIIFLEIKGGKVPKRCKFECSVPQGRERGCYQCDSGRTQRISMRSGNDALGSRKYEEK